MFKYLAFFEFYYLVISKRNKRFDMANDISKSMTIVMTPLVLFILHMLTAMFTESEHMILTLPINVPVIVLNMLMVTSVRNKAWKIQREQEALRREAEQMQREYERMRRNERERKNKQKENQQYGKQSQQTYTNTHKNNKLHEAFRVLGLEQTSDLYIIKKTYRELSKRYHPDICGGDGSKFIKIKNAYDLISKKVS